MLDKETSVIVMVKPAVKHSIHSGCSCLRWSIEIEMILIPPFSSMAVGDNCYAMSVKLR